MSEHVREARERAEAVDALMLCLSCAADHAESVELTPDEQRQVRIYVTQIKAAAYA